MKKNIKAWAAVSTLNGLMFSFDDIRATRQEAEMCRKSNNNLVLTLELTSHKYITVPITITYTLPKPTTKRK